jgi:REP element-mobilizing transposase RayT
MPRKARLDAPGTLHHVIIRGIEKRIIVDDDNDREDFVNRMGGLAIDTKTAIYAWALMSNHAHILLRSSQEGISRYMRRLLSGYAISYNLRHERHGHLFQNRYKSIVCEEDNYFKELVRYIHLNPFRANMVETPAKLEQYRWCGHGVVLGRQENDWQDRDYVLKWFGKKQGEAKKQYRDYVKKGIALGPRPELIGGGLVRSLGGWSAVKSVLRQGGKEKGDERILGSGEFVEKMIAEADRKTKLQFSTSELLEKAEVAMNGYCKKHHITMDLIRSGSRVGQISKHRAAMVMMLVTEIGLSMAESGRQLGLTTGGVAQIIRRRKFV